MVVLDQPPGLIHFPVSPLEGTSDLKSDLWMFALANAASIGYGLAADYIAKKRPTSGTIVDIGTIAGSLLAASFSVNLVISNDPNRNYLWRALGWIFTSMNLIVAGRAVVDLFRETHNLPGLHKMAREILAV